MCRPCEDKIREFQKSRSARAGSGEFAGSYTIDKQFDPEVVPDPVKFQFSETLDRPYLSPASVWMFPLKVLVGLASASSLSTHGARCSPSRRRRISDGIT